MAKKVYVKGHWRKTKSSNSGCGGCLGIMLLFFLTSLLSGYYIVQEVNINYLSLSIQSRRKCIVEDKQTKKENKIDTLNVNHISSNKIKYQN